LGVKKFEAYPIGYFHSISPRCEANWASFTCCWRSTSRGSRSRCRTPSKDEHGHAALV